MALPIKVNNRYGFAQIEENGGKGSGNFGHSGRPGQIGGSGNGELVVGKRAYEEIGKSHAEARQRELDEIEKSGGTVFRGKGDVYDLFKKGVDTVTMTKKDAEKIVQADSSYAGEYQLTWLSDKAYKAQEKLKGIDDDSLVDMILHNPQSDTEYPKYKAHKRGK